MTMKNTTKPYSPPRIGATQIRLLERLCTTNAVSGDEGAVRKIVIDEIRPYVSDLRIDALGNVLAVRQGQGADRLRVMLAAHMDEVGFMIVQDEEQGIFRFELVGGLDVRQLVGKPVSVGKDRTPGVIGAKPIHLSTSEERQKPITLETLRIDVSPDNARKVKVGDWATFATPFKRLGPSLSAKALDDRLGVVNLIELIKHAPDNIDLMVAFTVQEEVGLRGARVAAYALDPQLAFVIDATPANDLPPWNAGVCDNPADCAENTRYNTRLGAGPAIYVADAATLSDPRLIRYVMDIAERSGIPYQIRQPGSGGTDAGAIHKQRAGVPSLSISVPARYLHTPVSICRLGDWKNTLALLHVVLSHLTPAILQVAR